MLTGALLAVAVLGAPEDAAAKLRVAWASQYEWKESGVENVVLDFTYTHHWKGRKKDSEWSYGVRAQVVVGGDKIVRRHYPGVSEDRRKGVEGHLAWVLERFVREPFEEKYKEMTFSMEEPTEDGLLQISYAPQKNPDFKRYLLLRDDRIVGRVTRSGSRVSYTVESVEDGYTITGDETTWTQDDTPWSMSRRIELVQGEGCPLPGRYTYRLESPTGVTEVRIDFSAPKVNVKHPVVGDPAARDAVAEAWPQRHTLPSDIRIQAEFHRRIDKDLALLWWRETVKGDLQVWGMDSIKVTLDERLFRDDEYAPRLRARCEEHFRWFFGWLRDQPVDKEFEGCGFEFIESGDDESVAVLVFGHPGIFGLLIRKGRIAGYLGRLGDEEIWWRFRLRKARIESMSTKIGKDSYKLRFKYMRRKGVDVPKSFEVFGGPREYSRREGHGIAEYSLKKVKVSLPR
jgi:hypothetical protein